MPYKTNNQVGMKYHNLIGSQNVGAAKALGFGKKSEPKAKEATKGGKSKSQSIIAQSFPKMDSAKGKGNTSSAANYLFGNKKVAGTTSGAPKTIKIPHIIGSASK